MMLAPIRNITIRLIFCEDAYIQGIVVYNEGILFGQYNTFLEVCLWNGLN